MKKKSGIVILLVVLLGCLFSVGVFAQQEGPEKLRILMQTTTPEQRAQFEDHWMKKDLNLSSNQAAKVRQINLSSAQRMQSIFDSGGGRLRMFRDVMKARDDKDKELRKVLTAVQFTKYKSKKEKMWQKIHSLKGGRI